MLILLVIQQVPNKHVTRGGFRNKAWVGLPVITVNSRMLLGIFLKGFILPNQLLKGVPLKLLLILNCLVLKVQ